jgi:hypothetical protein
MEKPDAIIMGPFVGELYWEAGRFAPMLPWMKHRKYKGRDVKYIIHTREERFDLYGKNADILVPLRIDGDYDTKQPNCFRLNGLKANEYMKLVKRFKHSYLNRYNILEHIYPKVEKGQFDKKFQFPIKNMIFQFAPRQMNYELVNSYLPKNKPLVVLAPRYRVGFRRNWNHWPEFYDLVYQDKFLMDTYNFIICGKEGEYVPDVSNRFLDMNRITLQPNSSLVGVLLVIMESAFFTFGSQSAIPNISLLYKVEVLEFGCQKSLHTKTYNIHNSAITFIDNRNYDIRPKEIFNEFRKILKRKRGEIKNG